MKTLLDWQQKKSRAERISMLTCYDAWSAKLIAQTDIDAVLVGDSLAEVIHGHDTTLNACIDVMALHVSAVARHLKNKFIIGDMPFLSYRKSLSESMQAVTALMQAGAHAIKLEGAEGNIDLIRHITTSGVPVMGHLGLTPQSLHQIGGYRVQARTPDDQARLQQEATELQQAGCFALVLECVPSDLASRVSCALSIPVIGIGAGQHVDGQVLVLQDMLGLHDDFNAKFVKRFCDGAKIVKEAITQFHHEVQAGEFPTKAHSYHLTGESS